MNTVGEGTYADSPKEIHRDQERRAVSHLEPPQAPYGYQPQRQAHGYPPQPSGLPYAPPYVPEGPAYASWGRRAAAFLLDLLINFGPLYGLAGTGSALEGRAGETGDTIAGILQILGLVVVIVTIAFQLLTEGKTGQSVGKKALNIRAVRDGHGQTLGVGLALGRRTLQYLNFAIFGLGWWWAIWDTKSQTFADKLTNVVVVQADLPPAGQAPAPW